MKINLGGYHLHFEAYGQGERVLLFHGWGASCQIWQTFLPYLTALPYQFLAVDLPGFGQSDPLLRPFSLDDYTKMIRSLAEELDLQKPILIGHSFGGNVALAYALQNPVKNLILIDSAGIRRRSLKTHALLAASKCLKLLNIKPLNSLRRKAAPYLQAEDYRQISNTNLKETFRLTVADDLRNKIKNINTATLIIWGGEDAETPLRDAAIMKKEIKNSVLKVIPDSGHFPFLDHPETVAKLIAGFLLKP